MIEVTAKLVRGPVYLSGETVECCITFSNPLSPERKVSQSNDAFESLAWASAQIHCQCSTDSKLWKQKDTETDDSRSANSDTALTIAGRGRLEIATKPQILFCELQLAPGKSRSFIYRETLPSGDAPPSYRGQLIKYSYKITVGVQRIGSSVKLLHVPLRVLPLTADCIDADEAAVALLCNDTSEELTPANPFLETATRETSLDVMLRALQNITARRTPNFYMISNKHGKVARFCIFKSAYKLGEDVVGTFDFSVATVRCIQVSVSLQCTEETDCGSRITTYNRHHEVCLGLKQSQLVLPVPLHVAPSFSTSLVTISWRLHFEFVTSTSNELALPGPDQCGWQAPAQIPIETMVWSLPVRLYATSPAHISQATVHSVSPQHILVV